MFSYILKKFHFLKYAVENSRKENEVSKPAEHRLTKNLNENINALKTHMGKSSDLVFRDFVFGNKGQFYACLIFFDGLIDKKIIADNIIKPLMYDLRAIANNTTSSIESIDDIRKVMLAVGEVNKTNNINAVADGCLSGNTAMVVDGFNECLIIGSRGWEDRSVEESETETVVRGPRESFIETLRVNTSLLRRKIKNPNLTIETMLLGEKTRTDVCFAYIKGVANQKVVDEVKFRLSKIKTDAILESGYIEEFIEDAPTSIFATVGNSEKPDKIAAKLLEGRVAVLVDGTPFALIVPMLFVESFQSTEDYYSRPFYSSFIRLLRFISYSISALSPALYIALVNFHQELLPTPLIFTFSAAREGLPFPASVEIIIMLIVFEILREAGVRLPRPVGQTVSIVGALVLGESAVTAGLISPVVVIVVAITAISSFVVPAQTDSISILRLILYFLAAAMGLFGVMIGLICTIIHLSSLRSFGTPYLSPIAPFTKRDMKDTFIRRPMWKMITRPKTIGWRNLERMSEDLKPKPPAKND